MSDIKHYESTKKIYFSGEYGRFRFLKGNREINEAKVKKIITDIQSGIDFLSVAPVIVNKSMEIIDGQHRFVVAKMLGRAVHYIIHDFADLSMVPAINSKATKWKTVDFLNSYVDLKKQDYLELQSFLDNNIRISLPVAIKLLHDGHTKGENTIEDFREGKFMYKYDELADVICTKLKDLEPYTSNPFSARFVNVMLQIHNNGKYDHEIMIEKLKQSDRKIENIESVKTIISNMEEIYNHKLKNRVFIA